MSPRILAWSGSSSLAGIGDAVLENPSSRHEYLAFDDWPPTVRRGVRRNFPKWEPRSGDPARDPEISAKIPLCGPEISGYTARSPPICRDLPICREIPRSRQISPHLG